jgi:hypothetical protein
MQEKATRDELGFPLENICGEIKRGYFSDRPPEEAHLSGLRGRRNFPPVMNLCFFPIRV